MSFFSWLTNSKTIPDTISAVGDLYTTDKARLEGEAKLQSAIEKTALLQIENNKIMSVASSFFSNGWQPLIGWTAGFLILIYYAPQIMIAMYVWGKVSLHTNIIRPFPMKPDDILNLVYLLFGFGGYTLIKKKIT